MFNLETFRRDLVINSIATAKEYEDLGLTEEAFVFNELARRYSEGPAPALPVNESPSLRLAKVQSYLAYSSARREVEAEANAPDIDTFVDMCLPAISPSNDNNDNAVNSNEVTTGTESHDTSDETTYESNDEKAYAAFWR